MPLDDKATYAAFLKQKADQALASGSLQGVPGMAGYQAPQTPIQISNALSAGNRPPTPAGTSIGSAPITGYQQGLTPGNINQALGMTQGVYNTAGRLGGQFMNNAANAANPNYNPAIGAFNDATRSNMMNMGAALASQRGSSVDPGMAARSIGTIGANTQQQSVNQLGSLIDQYAMGQQQNALGAYGLQGNMAQIYGQIGLQNQAQILQAIANENNARVNMQSNINSSNVAMTSNQNNNATNQYLGQLGATTNIFDTQQKDATNQYLGQLGFLTDQKKLDQQSSGGFLSGLGSVLGLIPDLFSTVAGAAADAAPLAGGIAHGGQIKSYARGGAVRMANGGMAGPMDSMSDLAGVGPQSNTAKLLAQIGQMQKMAMGGLPQGAPGPSMPNLALAGSPDPRVAMPPTGMPMGNAQTRGGGPMPMPGQSGGYRAARGGQIPRMADGGMMQQQQQGQPMFPGMMQQDSMNPPTAPGIPNGVQQGQQGQNMFPNGAPGAARPPSSNWSGMANGGMAQNHEAALHPVLRQMIQTLRNQGIQVNVPNRGMR